MDDYYVLVDLLLFSVYLLINLFIDWLLDVLIFQMIDLMYLF